MKLTLRSLLLLQLLCCLLASRVQNVFIQSEPAGAFIHFRNQYILGVYAHEQYLVAGYGKEGKYYTLQLRPEFAFYTPRSF
jgi:hypothetical protein